MEYVPAFKTRDGMLFEDKSAAERHTVFLDKDTSVEHYLESDLNQYKALAQRSIAKTSIIGWELWKMKNETE